MHSQHISISKNGIESIVDIFHDIVSQGNIKVDADSLRLLPTTKTLDYIIEGTPSTALTNLLIPYNINWSVRNGILFLAKTGESGAISANIISEQSGMIGYPSITEKGISVEMMLNNTYAPGSNVKVQTSILSSFVKKDTLFKIIKVTHNGDTWSGDFSTKLELVASDTQV